MALEEGDVCDPVAMLRALKGCEAVISALSTRKISLFRQVTMISEATRLRTGLLAYCERDTLAIVEMHRALLRLAG